jgi:hypothetical protein
VQIERRAARCRPLARFNMRYSIILHIHDDSPVNAGDTMVFPAGASPVEARIAYHEWLESFFAERYVISPKFPGKSVTAKRKDVSIDMRLVEDGPDWN